MSNLYTNIINNGIAEAQFIRDIKEGWKQVKKSKDFVLSTIQYKNNALKLGRVQGTIPVNIEKAQKYYHENLQDQKETRELCDKMTKIEEIDQDNFISLFRTKGRLVVSPREMISIQNRCRLNENEILITRNNLDNYPNASYSKDAVRAEGKIYDVFLTKINDNQTKIEAFFLMDPKGYIPTALVNLVMGKQVDAFLKDSEKIQNM